ncbi:hypothetical protein BDA99DRAFT_537325 [Phascolomyces articulosus]|uniref:Pentacotripeptide-repeat region of PRORP domain-containing protein n=1 Tax=Phascolomyces articulosus TaxID=60185 RepID=A0AAD5K9Y3_9FUNG|nr:hypothetical protein BDA99DRAFT_537325 [Phascolomyces articulosus]
MRRLWINIPTRNNSVFCQCHQLPTPRILRIDLRSQRYTTGAATMACESSNSSINNNNNNNTMSTFTNNTTRRHINSNNKHRSIGNDFLEYLTNAERATGATTPLRQRINTDERRSVAPNSCSKKDKASALSDFYRSLATQDIDSIWPKYSYLYHYQYHKYLTRRNFRQLFLSAIRSRSTQRNLHRLLVLIDDMKERGMQLKCNEYDALMHWIGGRTVPVKKSHHLTEALALFDEMQQQRAIQPSLVTYNTLIHIASQVSDIRMAQRLYHDMIAHEIQPDAYTYATLLRSMGRMRDVDGMEQMLEQLQSMQHVANNTIIWNAALSGYAASGRIDDVKTMFTKMYNSLQQHNNNNNITTEKPQQNLELEDEGKEQGEKKAPIADFQSFRIYIEALLSQDEQEEAVQILEDMIQHDIEPIAVIYNNLFRSFMNEDREEEEEDNKPNDKNDLMMDETKRTQLATVKKLYQSMMELNVAPNSDTMYTLVSALLDLGDTKLALETFVQLNKKTATMEAVKDHAAMTDHDTVAMLAQRRFALDTTKPSKLEPNQELLERLGKIVK